MNFNALHLGDENEHNAAESLDVDYYILDHLLELSDTYENSWSLWLSLATSLLTLIDALIIGINNRLHYVRRFTIISVTCHVLRCFLLFFFVVFLPSSHC
jgi:hypothetical protein